MTFPAVSVVAGDTVQVTDEITLLISLIELLGLTFSETRYVVAGLN